MPNFRTGGMLPVLETSIAGVRAAVSFSFAFGSIPTAHVTDCAMYLQTPIDQEDRSQEIPRASTEGRRSPREPCRLCSVQEGCSQAKGRGEEMNDGFLVFLSSSPRVLFCNSRLRRSSMLNIRRHRERRRDARAHSSLSPVSSATAGEEG